MANSLVKLTLESNQYERGMRQAQKSWNDFTKGLGLSVSKFTAVGAAIGAVSGALKVAKDAFFKNEQQLDEWNRMVESSKSTYNGFLNALNNGDISGFLHNINTITEAARAAYDAMDALNTFNAFNQIQTQKTRTGFTEAMAGFRLGENSKEDVQSAAKAYQQELRQRQKLETEAYMQAIRKTAAERGVAWGALEQALTGKYGDYETLKNTMPTGKRMKYLPGGMFGGATAVEVPMAVTAQEKMGEALRQLNDTELLSLQALGAQAYKTGEEIAQIDKQLARVLNKKESTGGSGSKSVGGGRGGRVTANTPTFAEDSITAQAKLVQQLTTQWNDASAEMRNGYLFQLVEAEKKLKDMKDEQAALKFMISNGGDVKGSSPQGLADMLMPDLDKLQEELEKNPIVIHVDTSVKDIKAITKSAQVTAEVVGSIGDAFNAIEDPAAKVAGTVAQAVANVALGYAKALTMAEETGGPWGWIAFAATGMATMLSVISSIHSSTGYAQGGIVEGNTYSGDQIFAGLNAQEVVLTRAQAGNIASQLQEGGGGGGGVQMARISGEQIYVALNRYLKRTGQGELATWG